MQQKVRDKERVIKLRQRGFTYRNILKEVAVSKSSVSLWLKDLPLTEGEKKVLKRSKDSAIKRGRIRAAASLRFAREDRDRVIFFEAKKEFSLFISESLFQVGLALYWAEGSKRSNQFAFTNSDFQMINLMVDWMERYFSIPRSEIRARLYIHKPYAHERCEEFWSSKTGISIKNFRRTIYKPTPLLIKKRPGYRGCIRIEVGKVAFFRKMVFWQQMFLEHYKKER